MNSTVRKLLFLTAAAILSAVNVSAQKTIKISGFITDGSSGESIPGAIVLCGSRGSTTNSYGFYSMNVGQGQNLLKFKFLGYKDQSIEAIITGDTTINVSLIPHALMLDEVKVTSRLPVVVNRDMGRVTVNVRQLKYTPLFLGEQDIFKYLHILPGISAGKEGSSGLNIRGGSSDQTLILLDDVPIYNQSHAFGFISIFNGAALKTADVYKGYMPPEYGERLSGVALLQMRDGNRKSHHQSLQVGTLTATGTAEGPLMKNRGAYLVSARGFVPALFLKGYSTLKANSDATRIGLNFYDVMAKLSFDLNKSNSLYASFYTGHDNFDVRLNGFDDAKLTKTSKSIAGFGWGGTILSLRWSSVLRHNMFLSTTAYCSILQNEKRSKYENIKGKYINSAYTRSKMTELGWRASVNHNVSDTYILNYGTIVSLRKFEPQIIEYTSKGLSHRENYGKMDLMSCGIFLNNKLSAGDFDFNYGARVILYDNTKYRLLRLEPRISASWKTDPNSSLWLTYVSNTQPLFSMNRYYFAMPIDYWVPYAGKTIQQSQQITLGGKAKLFNIIDLSAEIYYKKMKNLSMVYEPENFLYGDGGYDIATGKAYGCELSLQYAANRYSVIGSYSYSKSNRTVDGKNFPFEYDTPHDLNIFGMYDIVREEGRKHTLSLNMNWKTGLPYIISNENYPSTGHLGTGSADYNPLYPNSRLINYFRTDLSYNMERIKKNGVRNWQISILNVTGHKNPYVLFKKDGKYKSLTLIPFMPSVSYKRTF